MVTSTLIILAFIGFWVSFSCGRQIGESLTKLQHVTKCMKCKNFWSVEPVWDNSDCNWFFRWMPKQKEWKVFIHKEGKVGKSCNPSITKATQNAVKNLKYDN